MIAMRSRVLALSVVLAGTLVGNGLSPALAQEAAGDADPAIAAAEKQAEAYMKAFNGGDADALAALFAADAAYSVGDAEAIVGREAIKERSAAFFEEAPERELKIVVQSARFLTPDVLVEKGISMLAVGDGYPEATRYSATHVKKDGKWQIADVEETVLPPADEAAEALSTLSWMIGEWKSATEGVSAVADARWVLQGRFINRNFTIDRGEDEDALQGAELIGYDVPRGEIRSWTFDSEGGFGEATWRQEGNKWLVTAKSSLPDGSESSAQHVFTVVDKDRFTVESINRMVDGEALPNTDEVEVVRVKEAAGN